MDEFDFLPLTQRKVGVGEFNIRGLKALVNIQKDETFLDIPFQLLLHSLLASEFLEQLMKTRVSQHQSLVAFVLLLPYMKGVPVHFIRYLKYLSKLNFDTVPLVVSKKLNHILLPNLKEEIRIQKSKLRHDFLQIRKAFRPQFNDIRDSISFDKFTHAWLIVNTRSVCIPRWKNCKSNESTIISLVPLFDMLNHSFDVTVIKYFTINLTLMLDNCDV